MQRGRSLQQEVGFHFWWTFLHHAHLSRRLVPAASLSCLCLSSQRRVCPRIYSAVEILIGHRCISGCLSPWESASTVRSALAAPRQWRPLTRRGPRRRRSGSPSRVGISFTAMAGLWWPSRRGSSTSPWSSSWWPVDSSSPSSKYSCSHLLGLTDRVD